MVFPAAVHIAANRSTAMLPVATLPAVVAALVVSLWTALAVAQGAPPADAQPDGDAPRVARLIRQLGSGSYSARRAARDELDRAGLEVRPHLEAATAAADPEIRLAAAALLHKWRLWDLWQPSRVSLDGQATTAAEVLARIADQTGNRLLLGEQYGAYEDRPSRLVCAQRPFWEVMDDFCRQTDNHVRPHYDTNHPGLVLVSGPLGSCPVAYAGPIRAQIVSARRVFIEELDYHAPATDRTHTFQFNLQLLWEDRFRLAAYRAQPELVEAVTETGARLTATQSGGGGWNVASSGTRQLTMTLRLSPPTTAAARLSVLSLKWGLLAVGDMASFTLDNLAAGHRARGEGIEVAIEAFEAQAPRYELVLDLVRDLVVPEPHEVLFQENSFELCDTQGRPLRLQGQTNTLTERGARIRLSFVAAAAGDQPQSLRIVYPRLRAQHDLAIAFHDVPLPNGRPD